MEKSARKEYDSPREDFRLNVTIPFAYDALDEDPDPMKKDSRVFAASLKGLAGKFEGGIELAAALKIINDKIDQLVSQLDTAGKSMSVPDLAEINISAGGLSFWSDKPFASGDEVRLTMGLPPAPYTLINTLARVIRSIEKTSGKEKRYEVAARFQHLDEDERQDITRFLFDVQRKALR